MQKPVSLAKPTALILAAAPALLTASEAAYRMASGIPAAKSLAVVFACHFVMFALFCACRTRFVRLLVFIVFAMGVVGNNIHWEVYRSWITAINYYLGLKEFSEVLNAAPAYLEYLALPVLWGSLDCVVFAAAGAFARRGLKPLLAGKAAFAADALFLVIVAALSLRSFNTSQEWAVSPKAEAPRTYVNLVSMGYFLGNTLPRQCLLEEKSHMVSIPAPKAAGSPKSSTVVLVVGESVTSSHVSALGYPRETTPFLQSLKGSPNALIREIYSAGKMTSVALPSFMNAIPYPDGTAQIATGATNLLRLAKNQGFATRWHTAQAKGEMAIMNTIGGRWLDAATFPTDHGFAWAESMSDFELLPYLDGIGEEKAFVVLHQRGSHAPYAALTPEAFRVFGETRLDLYDATVRAMDGFLQACLEKLARRPGKNWVLVYVSDHGQFVTQNEATQGGAEFDAFAVPLFVYSPDARLVDSAAKWFAEHAPSHYQLAVWISRLLGYDAQPVTEEVIVNNNLLSGGAGWVSVSEDKTVTSHRW